MFRVYGRVYAGQRLETLCGATRNVLRSNSVPADKHVPSILTLMGSKMYALLRSISAPRKPKELNFTEIVDNLAQHVDPKPIIIAERYKLHKQEESETVRQYLATLQKLAETCEFGAYREEVIRDRFVCGLRSQSIQSIQWRKPVLVS